MKEKDKCMYERKYQETRMKNKDVEEDKTER